MMSMIDQVFSPLCDDLLDECLTAEEANFLNSLEVNYLCSLLEEQDRAYETKSQSPTLENHVDVACTPIRSPPLHDFVEVELVDFLGVDNFNLVYHPYIVDIVNSLKINLVWTTHLVELMFLKRIRQLLYSKYLFLWHGRVQFLTKSLEWSVELMLIVIDGIINVRNPHLAEHTYTPSLSLSFSILLLWSGIATRVVPKMLYD